MVNITPGYIGAAVVAHIFFIAGCYIFTWGMLKLVKGSATFAAVLKSPVFWGLIVLLMGFCTIAALKFQK